MYAYLDVFCILALLAYYATAQQVPTCLPGFEWSFNHLGQNPCSIASSLIETCVGIPFPIPTLDQNVSHTYGGPQAGKDTPCTCNTVVYSLLSACAICQKHGIIQWQTYVTNCSQVAVESYTPPIPAGVSVPHYAYLNVTAANIFNASLAETAGGPESSGPPVPTSAPTTPQISTTAGPKHSHVGAIAGGVVGGVVGLATIIALCSYFVMQRNKKYTITGPFYDEPLGEPTSYNVSQISHQNSSLKYYNPDDPSTFPEPLSNQRLSAYSIHPQA